MKRNYTVTIVVVLGAAMALLHVVRFADPGFTQFIADRTLLVIAGWVKLAALLTATLFAFRSALLLDSGNAARRSWLTFGAGLAFFSLGQATLTAYQTFTGATPFPSIADVWFVIAYPLLTIALVAFTVTYARSGFATQGLTAIAVIATAAVAALAWPVLGPIARTPAPPLATALNIAYPALDFVLLIPAIVLLSLTSRFRGGAVWRIWAALLAGVVFTAVGDIGFAYFSTLGLTRLDPLVHAMYIVAYVSMAVGTNIQFRLLEPDAVTMHDLVRSREVTA